MMKKHFLVTVSEHKSAHYGIRFMDHFFPSKEEIKVTLFYTAPRPPALWEGERTRESLSHSERQARQYEIKGRKALETAKTALIKMGFNGEQVGIKFQVRRFSKVEDIIQEGGQGLYDAVVLGRRGLSLLEAAFDESVTKELMSEKVGFPIWFCRIPDMERKNVLVCVDGSEASYRMADHVGYILGNGKGQEVTLLMVKRPGGTSKESPEDILSKSRERLLGNGFPEDMTRTKIIEARNIADTILREAEKGTYAAVALGRTGAGQGLLKKIFMGSVSDTLFRELRGAAMWVCR
jgi:nucleotide-binding universal stress UspA family protein